MIDPLVVLYRINLVAGNPVKEKRGIEYGQVGICGKDIEGEISVIIGKKLPVHGIERPL